MLSTFWINFDNCQWNSTILNCLINILIGHWSNLIGLYSKSDEFNWKLVNFDQFAFFAFLGELKQLSSCCVITIQNNGRKPWKNLNWSQISNFFLPNTNFKLYFQLSIWKDASIQSKELAKFSTFQRNLAAFTKLCC